MDLYRPTKLLPALAFSRMLLLARTLLSAAMMILYGVQTGRARLGASRWVLARAGSVLRE